MNSVFHGGRLDRAIAEFGGVREDWIDLSTGINPNPYPVPEFSSEDWSRLPDVSAESGLISAARAYYGVREEAHIVPSAGTQALIQLIPTVVNANTVEIVSPTYGEYRHVLKNSGKCISAVDDIEGITAGTDLAIIVNPNNPDGCVHDPNVLVELANRVGAIVVDEAFCDTSPNLSIVPNLPRNVIVLKSFGKFFGLAGVRLGFAICHDHFAKKFSDAIGPWAVSGPAIAVGKAALSDQGWIDSTRANLIKASAQLENLLRDYDFEISGVNPLFVYARHNHATEMQAHLSSHHVLARPFPDREGYLRFGLPRNVAELVRLGEVLGGFHVE